MQAKLFGEPLTDADTYVFPRISNGHRQTMSVSGIFGAATATIGFLSPAGNFVSFKDSVGGSAVTALTDEEWVVELPVSRILAVQVVGMPGLGGLTLNIAPSHT
jgi:uncharacterized membrane protein